MTTNSLSKRLPTAAGWLVTMVFISCGAVLVVRLLLSGFWLLHVGVALRPAFRYLAPPVGAGLAAWLVLRREPRARGTGTDDYIAAWHGGLPLPGLRLSLAKAVATVFTVGSGGSGGLVGPAIQVGAGMAGLCRQLHQRIGQPRGWVPPDRRHLAVGAGAALGALLGAPLASGLLAAEVLRRTSVEWSALPYTATGALFGHTAYTLVWRREGLALPPPAGHDVRTLLLAAASAILAAALGIALVATMRLVARVSLRMPLLWACAGGGALVGLLAAALGTEVLSWASADVLGQWIQAEAHGIQDLGLAAGKVLATALTVGSGASGGVVGPSLKTGVLIGRGLAGLSGSCQTGLAVSAMAASLTAVANVPLAAALLMLELYGPGVAVFAALGAAAGFGLARGWVAYEALAKPKATQP